MSIYELQIKPYKSITLNKVDCNSIEVKSLNYETLTNKGYGVKILPLYFVQQEDISLNFSESYYIDFKQIGILRDLNINKGPININSHPHYIYSGSTKKILIELCLIYSNPKTIEYPSRYTINFQINNKDKSKIYYGVNDTLEYDNVFVNKYIINISDKDKIHIYVKRVNVPSDISWILKEGSYISFSEI
jgi:hypothetical protein